MKLNLSVNVEKNDIIRLVKFFNSVKGFKFNPTSEQAKKFDKTDDLCLEKGIANLLFDGDKILVSDCIMGEVKEISLGHIQKITNAMLNSNMGDIIIRLQYGKANGNDIVLYMQYIFYGKIVELDTLEYF